jgi:hypothetical protein
MNRKLSDGFLEELKIGILSPILDRVKKDTTLSLEIREDYFNIYFKGSSLAKVVRFNKKSFELTFKEEYFLNDIPAELCCRKIFNSKKDTEKWVQQICIYKDTIDLYSQLTENREKICQQEIIWANNFNKLSGKTDYFIVDFEYNSQGYDNMDDKSANFDLIAFQWDSNPIARKLQKGFLPIMTVIEVKFGDLALKDAAGIIKHCEDWINFKNSERNIKKLSKEMINIFSQKRDLGLIPTLKTNKNPVRKICENVKYAFVLIDQDPDSKILSSELEKLSENYVGQDERLNDLYFGTSRFYGFGLFKDQFLSLQDFREKLN